MGPPSFEDFFERTLRDRIRALEAVRSGLAFQAINCGVVAILGGLVVGTALMQYYEPHPYFFLAPAAILGILAERSWFLPWWKEYAARFKGEIIAEIVGFISPTLAYHPRGKITRDIYMESGIFSREPDSYGGEDYVSGTVGATAFRFSEVCSEYAIKGKTTQYVPIFKGLFFQGDFNKHFNGRTYVLTDAAEKSLGSLIGQSLQRSHGDARLVKLEDPVFEKEFVVYATDQIESRYILTPALMTRIVEFKKKAGRDIQLSFVGSSVYVAIPYAEDLFEPRLFGSVVRTGQVRGYYEALTLAISIVEDLNLNTRIWTKV